MREKFGFMPLGKWRETFGLRATLFPCNFVALCRWIEFFCRKTVLTIMKLAILLLIAFVGSAFADIERSFVDPPRIIVDGLNT